MLSGIAFLFAGKPPSAENSMRKIEDPCPALWALWEVFSGMIWKKLQISRENVDKTDAVCYNEAENKI